ncbi:porin family protein [Hymenobacter sp. BRD67]|uniref:porin family protein n=1 Tax=Hymenobacter sp. BRD67 TaxID=2675877 RepID=UPI001567BB1F|nr:porin family protein [Hymenobacter sp. BRD67]QKG53227.1 PorT family protein [Hymenobacter sp. BRD67]
MKKVLLSLALLAGFAGTANAQSGVLKYGVKGGFSLSSYSGSEAGDVTFKPGFTAGALINYGFSDLISLQVEALYSQKGALVQNYSTAATTNNTQFRSTVQYIDVPVLAKFTTGENGKGLFFEVGPQASFLVATRDFTRPKDAGAGSSQEVEINTDTNHLNKVAIGYVGGIGYQLTSGLGLGIRYTGDFSNVYKDGINPLPGVTTTNNFRNSVFQFQVHYLFGGKS